MSVSHRLFPGETLHDVAMRRGHHPQTIWNDPANATIRDLRGRPIALVEGDVLVIPDVRPRQESCQTHERHVFRRLGWPATPWIAIRVVDDPTGSPVANVELNVGPSNGQERKAATGPDGIVEVQDVDRGGVDVSSEFAGAHVETTLDFVDMGESPSSGESNGGMEGAATLNTGGTAAERPGAEARKAEVDGPAPKWIAQIEAHKVRTGETIASLAEGAGLTWQALAQFNWGTSVPDRINQHLRDDVGCTRKTVDGRNYVFTSDDEPGIVYIPRPWSLPGLATDRMHTVRVRKLTPTRLVEWEFSI
ncbi:MAG: LysM domain-containing protein [Phycisphaerales bacterium]|nr:MAG: LysM domain-containing protein [Phycisphaerales bacterium]